MSEEHGQVREEQLDPEREARRRLALAQVRQYPDPALRMRAHEVEEFDDDLRRLVERMIGLMQDANGVGRAGTQAGVLQRVFVFQPHAEDEPRALVNPEIVERSDETVSDDEWQRNCDGDIEPLLQIAIYLQCALGAQEGPLAEL